MSSPAVVRPGPLRWLGYALGTGLPARHRAWVLHDVTARTWRLRHFARTTVQLAPFAVALFLLIPGPAWVRGAAVLAGLLLGFFYSAVYLEEMSEHRAVKAGYPRGTAAAVRAGSRAAQDREQARRYAQRWRTPE